MNVFFFYLRVEIFVFMVVFFNEVVVFFGGDYVFFLDVMIIWTFRNVIIYVFIYFGGYIGYRFFSVFIIL